jgi:hypothetical protein
MEVPSPPRRAPECDIRCAVIALGSAHHDDVGDAIGVVAVARWEGDAAAGRTGQRQRQRCASRSRSLCSALWKILVNSYLGTGSLGRHTITVTNNGHEFAFFLNLDAIINYFCLFVRSARLGHRLCGQIWAQ